MPFTPLHVGPGILFKAFMRGGLSLMVFGWAQIVMDIEPLVALFTGQGHMHGLTHTYIGASFLAMLSALSGKYLVEIGLRRIGRTEYLPIDWVVAFVSAGVGTYSHVFLDSIIHADIKPFFPFSQSNLTLGTFSFDTLHWLCLGTGIVGAVLYFVLPGRKADYAKSAELKNEQRQ